MGAGIRSIEIMRTTALKTFRKILRCYTRPLKSIDAKKPYEPIVTVPELYVRLKGCHAARDAPVERHHGVFWGQLNTVRTGG